MSTPISYWGGKQSIMHVLLPMVPPLEQREVYTEVFFGGGSLFWEINPASPAETINDKLDIVVNFYRVLKTRYAELKVLIDASLISRTMHKEASKIAKGYLPASDVYYAWAFWYCCNFSYGNKFDAGTKYSNSGRSCGPDIIANKKREFTDLLVARIEHAYIEHDDAIKILRSRNVVKGFHYEDPPYMNADQGHYGGYTTEMFRELLEWNATECKGRFLLSNYPSDILTEYIEKYKWKTKTVKHSSKHTTGGGHKPKPEVLVWNYTEPAFQPSLPFDL